MRKGRGDAVEEIVDQLELFRLVFDTIPSGAVVTDTNGTVVHLNKNYARFLGIDAQKSIGKHCTEILENTRMHVVGKTGKAEINQVQVIRGQTIVVHRIPMRRNGRMIAVLGLVMFQDSEEVVKLAKKLHSLESKVTCYEKELMHLRSAHYTLDSIIGVSKTIVNLKKDALIASNNSTPVLITGESGTGKELFAQAIHNAGSRKRQPFIQINCAAIPKDLLESELFGYDQGAFTGALAKGKPGKFELADHGTIFLDEIGDLPLEMQPKLLRVLEEKSFERVGGNKLIRSDFKLIAATNQDLEGLITGGNFRNDLYYRLNVISLNIPPLRERLEDVSPLTLYLLKKLTRRNGCPPVQISPAAMDCLASHSWPGNVRELSNVLERVLLTIQNDTIQAENISFITGKSRLPKADAVIQPIRNIRGDAEKTALLAALEKTSNNKAKAADLLGIHRTLLYKKMKKHGLPL